MALRRRAAEKAAQREVVDLEAMVQSGSAGAYEALQLYHSKATRLRAKNDQRGKDFHLLSIMLCHILSFNNRFSY
jgi:hypothetical protein